MTIDAALRQMIRRGLIMCKHTTYRNGVETSSWLPSKADVLQTPRRTVYRIDGKHFKKEFVLAAVNSGLAVWKSEARREWHDSYGFRTI